MRLEEKTFTMSGDCHRCGRPGHWARECRNGPSPGGFGRIRSDFRNGGGRIADKCYKCNRPGHFARECKMEQERCYKCNQLGHIAKECDKEIDSGACYNCKSPGHVQRDCPQGSQRPCFRCGENGHIVRDCPDSDPRDRDSGRGGGLPDNRNCYACGGVGHIIRECPTAAKSRDCYRNGGGPIRTSRDRPSSNSGPYRWTASARSSREVKWN
jgi:cellular nucleic acid-binding protein